MIVTSLIYVISQVFSLVWSIIPEINFTGFEIQTVLNFIYTYFLEPVLYIFPLFFALKLLVIYLLIINYQFLWNCIKTLINIIRGSGA